MCWKEQAVPSALAAQAAMAAAGGADVVFVVELLGCASCAVTAAPVQSSSSIVARVTACVEENMEEARDVEVVSLARGICERGGAHHCFSVSHCSVSPSPLSPRELRA